MFAASARNKKSSMLESGGDFRAKKHPLQEILTASGGAMVQSCGWADRDSAFGDEDKAGKVTSSKGRVIVLSPSVGKAFAFDAGLDEVGAGAIFSESFAGGFDTEALANGAETEASGNAVVQEIEVAVFKLDDFAAIDTDEMVVGGAVEEVGVVGGLAVAEFNFVNEVGLGEKGQGAVNGGAGGPGTGGAKTVEEVVGSEVFVSGEDDFDDFIPLRGLPESLFADEIIQSCADPFFHRGERIGILS